jgi:hypothetical protein
MVAWLLLSLCGSLSLIDVLHGEWDVYNGTSIHHDPSPLYYCECHPSTKSKSAFTATLWLSNGSPTYFWNDPPSRIVQLEMEFTSSLSLRISTPTEPGHIDAQFAPGVVDTFLTTNINWFNGQPLTVAVISGQVFEVSVGALKNDYVAYLQKPAKPARPVPFFSQLRNNKPFWPQLTQILFNSRTTTIVATISIFYLLLLAIIRRKLRASNERRARPRGRDAPKEDEPEGKQKTE